MAKRTPNSSRPAAAGRTTTTTIEPSAAPAAVPPTASEPSVAPVAVPLPVLELPPALVSLPPADTGATSPPQPPNAPSAPIPAEKDPVKHVEEQLNRLLDVLASTVGRVPTTTWTPAISVYETPVELLVAIDVPGTTRDALDVRTERGLLVISGQRNPSPVGGSTIRHAEMCFGPFRRVIPLPPGLRTADMKTHVECGVLHVQIPRDGSGGARPAAVE
jgi:HSP20 family protein